MAITLVMLMAIPCSAKLELKEWLHVENSTQPNTGKHKISCTNFQELKQTTEKVKVQENLLPFIGSLTSRSIFNVIHKIKLLDFFQAHKEKIPTYLSIARLLI